MEVLKEYLRKDIDQNNADMINLTLIRGRKPVLCEHNRRLVLDGLMRCVERADVPVELVVAVYFCICYST